MRRNPLTRGLNPRAPQRFALALRSRSNGAHCMPARLFYSRAPQRSAASPSRFARAIPALAPRSPDLLAHKRALFSTGQKRLRDARTYFRINRQILTLGEVFVGLPSGRKTTYVCAVPAVSKDASSLRASEKSRLAIWSWRRDLNPRPSDYKSDALPAELRQRKTSRNRAQS